MLQLGNPFTDDHYDYKGLADYAWSHTVVLDAVHECINQKCDFKTSNWTDDCKHTMKIVYQDYIKIDKYNIYGLKCLLDLNSSSSADMALLANNEVKLHGNC